MCGCRCYPSYPWYERVTKRTKYVCKSVRGAELSWLRSMASKTHSRADTGIVWAARYRRAPAKTWRMEPWAQHRVTERLRRSTRETSKSALWGAVKVHCRGDGRQWGGRDHRHSDLVQSFCVSYADCWVPTDELTIVSFTIVSISWVIWRSCDTFRIFQT